MGFSLKRRLYAGGGRGICRTLNDYLAESGAAFTAALQRMAIEARKTSMMRPALQRLPSSKSVVGGVDSQA